MGRATERVLVAAMLLTALQSALGQENSEQLQERSASFQVSVPELRANTSANSSEGSSDTCQSSCRIGCKEWKKLNPCSGVRTVHLCKDPITVYCDQTTDNGGWTVFQRRVNNSVDFYRDWEDYRKGFGDLEGNFWLGLDKLHSLTASGRYQLRVDLEDWSGGKAAAAFSGFYVDGASNNFALHFDSSTGGNAGDSLSFHNGYQFTTKDRDHDTSTQNCAKRRHGAWWYGWCFHSNLNGEYKTDSSAPNSDGIIWMTYRGYQYSLKFSEMKIREM